MARKPRIEFAGAIYHVLNRGNYRADLFHTPGAAQAFLDCLFETCERMGWVMHAFCLMRNHYHLALETPRGNLVEGVHWLQSTFGNRFNRFRNEHGRAFQGRYQAILVEPGDHLATLVDYIHLNPVRAGIVSLEQLAQFRWSSYRLFNLEPARRPAFLTCADWLTATHALTDTPAGWKAYAAHLASKHAEKAVPTQTESGKITRSWFMGGKEFKAAMLAEFKRLKQAQDWGGPPVKELNRVEWEQKFDEAMGALGKTSSDALADEKSSSWKIAVAAHLKRSTSVNNRWLADRLNMGSPDALSRYLSDLRKGLRPGAEPLVAKLAGDVAQASDLHRR